MKKIIVSPLLRITLSIIVGLTFVMFPNTTLKLIVTILGILLVVPSLVMLLYYNGQRKAANSRSTATVRFPIESLSLFLLGSSFIIVPSFFIGVLMYILGILLIFAGVYQLLFLSTASKSAKVTPIFYFIPIIILLSGVVVFINPFETSAGILTLFGATTLLYGVNEIIEYIKFK